jgi:Mrp family chromosome partitioning ATPase
MTVGRHAPRHALDQTAASASLLSSAVKKPLPVMASVLVGLALGLFVVSITPPSYTAVSEILVDDVRASGLFQVSDIERVSTQQSERYLADQVALLRSSVIARRAADLLDGRFSERYILEEVAVDGDATSNLIRVEAPASTPEEAKELADTLTLVYLDLKAEQLRSSAEAAIGEIDGLLRVVQEDLDRVNAAIDELLAADTQTAEVNVEFDQTVASLRQLRQSRDATPVGSLERDAINAQINERLQDLQAFNLVFGSNRNAIELERLTSEEATLNERRLELDTNRSAILVASELTQNVGALNLESLLPEDQDRLSPLIVIALFVILGVLVGASISYVLVHRRTRVESRYEPEETLDAPLLGTIRLPRPFESEMVVVQEPDSGAAYAYRFAASALDLRTAGSAKVVMVVSANQASHRSVIVANLAAATSLSGLRVLAVDADFQVQGMTRFLFGGLSERGLIDFVFDGASLDYVMRSVPLGGGREMHVLPQSDPGSTPALMQGEFPTSLFSEIAREHDLIILDAPAVLEAAYTATLATFVEGLVVVVEHGMDTEALEELAARLELTQTPVLGYLYVAARDPRRFRWTRSTSSRDKGAQLSDEAEPVAADKVSAS